ncbi:MAG: hypothetical protein Q7R39_20520, partial [Dehalococcoidia bacterium]|nr:hypothetical protein [Dehalococcoidia bacterium]
MFDDVAAIQVKPPIEYPPYQDDLGTHLTQGVVDVIRAVCMFAVRIFPGRCWTGFKRLSTRSQ